MVCAIMLTGCDDGDLVYESINFDNIAVSRCAALSAGVPSDVLYKLNGSELLLLRVSNLDAVLPDAPTPEDTPVLIPVSANNQIFYRQYASNATPENFCGVVQSPNPPVTTQWHVSSGNIQIVTSAIKTANNAQGFPGGEKITSLRHGISLRQITFETSGGAQTYDVFPFGNYEAPFNAPALETFGLEANRCSGGMVYKNSGVASMQIAIDPALLDTSVLNTVKTGTVSPTQNTVFYTEFAPGSDLSDLCDAMPVAQSQWTTGQGVLSAQIEVVTVSFGSGFKHEIRLKNLTLAQDNLSFLVASDYFFGELFE